jgi:hydrogenase maturation protein HypF
MQEHVRIQLSGKVQGVGFRPFVAILANQLNLFGYAINRVHGLEIYLFGEKETIAFFEIQLTQNAPKYACISNLIKDDLDYLPSPSYKNFEIRYQQISDQNSLNQTTLTLPADRALCKLCLSELFDSSNKRFLHPFISCIDCGPRASIIHQFPYERANTSYQDFSECQSCQNESSSIVNKQTQRFHSQTNSCWQCGPTLSLFQQGKEIYSNQNISSDRYSEYFDKLASAITSGKVIAFKGIGGFHLVCDARNPKAISKLRDFKHRPEKPFAIMALNIASLKALIDIDVLSNTLLESEAAPIVLCPKKSFTNSSSIKETIEALAPKVSDVGTMLPYTAMHYLLFYALLGKPKKQTCLSEAQEPLLVITSANISGEPLISKNQECIEKMSDIAEYILCHDRDIVLSCDDSVIQSSGSKIANTIMIRRARGLAPEPIQLSFSGKAVLAFGAHLKHTFCLSDCQQAFLSPHLGEPESIASYDHFEDILSYYLKQLSIKPEVIACDSHPDFFSSQFAKDYAQKNKLPLVQVPHHRAHIAAVLAEIPLPDNSSFIGLILDGIGLGESIDETINPLWGGELFLGNLSTHGNQNTKLNLQHIAQISKLSLPGGDQATKEIGRIGFAVFDSLKNSSQSNFETDFSLSSELKQFIQTNSLNFPNTSALGRWFDAISSLLGIRQSVSYEAQAAMELEALAQQYGALPASRHLAKIDEHNTLDLYPILPAILSSESVQEAAAIFHTEIVDGLLRWLLKTSKQHNTKHVVCSGGCFQNRIIRNALFEGATEKGLIVYYPKQVPLNDAGISLGQVLIASLNQNLFIN